MTYVQDYANQLLLFLFFFSIIAVCLLAASIMDWKTCTVYNYIWWIMGGAVTVRLFTERLLAKRLEMEIGRNENVWLSVFLFILLQELFFCRMYGRADSHGFAACALVGGSLGMGMKEYLLHMLIAFGLLGVVQWMRGNIGRDGNLKKPVPFVPYLTVAFWLNLGVYLCV